MINDMNKILEAVREIDGPDSRFRIRQSDFDDLLTRNNSGKTIRALTNKTNLNQWTTFKKNFIEVQTSIGFEWSASPGKGGPLQLVRVILPGELGIEFAKKAFEEEIEKASVDDLISRFLPAWNEYFRDVPSDIEFDDTIFRDSFKKTTVGKNKSYRFAVGRGKTFSLVRQTYSFGKKYEKNPEYRLGELVTPLIRSGLGLDSIVHSQHDHGFRVYENVDMVGFWPTLTFVDTYT